jgi:hypothetical protein
MELIKDKNQWFDREKLRSVDGHIGICDGCGVSIEYHEKFEALLIEDSEEKVVLVPLVMLTCPSCGCRIGNIRYFKNMNVTEELNSISKKVA